MVPAYSVSGRRGADAQFSDPDGHGAFSIVPSGHDGRSETTVVEGSGLEGC